MPNIYKPQGQTSFRSKVINPVKRTPRQTDTPDRLLDLNH